MKREKRKHRLGMFLLFSIVVFLAIVVNIVLTGAIAYLLVHFGAISISAGTAVDAGKLILLISLLSLPIGLVLAVTVSKIPFKPVRDLAAGMNRLADGDFAARLEAGPLLKSYPAFTEVVESFNKMAQELESTEMLRGDFINNFSHEFKTPIVSIAGFAKLLKRGNLPEAQQREYLSVIEEESMRLSYMATNVLNLTKVENQTILTDVTEFNLSEQLRGCILLLEDKWEKKNLDLQPDFGEYAIRANEELLKQVWINLLDNAIKFAPTGHTVQVGITETENTLAVSITNTGSEIAPEQQKKIWSKFYQADESHAAKGNGVGLAIVKRITELHGGQASVTSGNEVTTFTVTLPK